MTYRFFQSSVVVAIFVFAYWVNHCALAATIGNAQQIGTFTSSTLDEISGLATSRSMTDVLWVHNDSGDSARFFAVNRAGALLGTFPLSGAAALDWEDMAIAPDPSGGNYLYFGDIGDNNSLRTSIRVYRTAEPQSAVGATIASNAYTFARLQYPGGARNAESLFIDPATRDLYIITKGSTTEIFRAPATAFDNSNVTTTLTALGTVGAEISDATAADISPDGRFILIRNSKSRAGFLFERGPGQNIADALHGNSTVFQVGNEAQGEAIAGAADGKSFYTTSEFSGGSSAPLYSYAFSAPPLLPGDYNNDHIVDAADYAVWRNQFGEEIELPNEADTPGVVSDEDYTVWKAHYGQTLGSGSARFGEAATLPEPETLAVAFWGVLLAVQSHSSTFRRR